MSYQSIFNENLYSQLNDSSFLHWPPPSHQICPQSGYFILLILLHSLHSPLKVILPRARWLVVKNLLANAGDIRAGSIPSLGKSPGGGDGKPLRYSCLESPMDRGAWWATAMGSQTIRHDWSDLACTLHGGEGERRPTSRFDLVFLQDMKQCKSCCVSFKSCHDHPTAVWPQASDLNSPSLNPPTVPAYKTVAYTEQVLNNSCVCMCVRAHPPTHPPTHTLSP